jgi:hypothetical protein
MPNIVLRPEWSVCKGVYLVGGAPALHATVPKELKEELGWKQRTIVRSAVIAQDMWLVWKVAEEPIFSVTAKQKIAPSFHPIEYENVKQKEDLSRMMISQYILGAKNIEITSQDAFDADFVDKLIEETRNAFSIDDVHIEEKRIAFVASQPLNLITPLKNLFNEAYQSVSKIIELLLKGKFDKKTFDGYQNWIGIFEKENDRQKRAILRNAEVNKIDEIENMPYIVTIVKYLEPTTDYALDMIGHVERMADSRVDPIEFDIPGIVVDYARKFHDTILSNGYFIDPTEDYEDSFLNKAINECIRVEKEEAMNALEKLEKSKLKGKKLVNSCFLISRISTIARNLHNMGEVKYDWQNSSRT